MSGLPFLLSKLVDKVEDQKQFADLQNHFVLNFNKPQLYSIFDVNPQMNSKKLLSELAKLSSYRPESDEIYKTALDILFAAFEESKPLFTREEDKSRAGEFLIKSLPHFDHQFALLATSFETDLRSQAQKARSGLQYLVEEFNDKGEVYDKLKALVDSENVKTVEEYILNTKDIPLEYSNFSKTPDLEKIPPSHHWWF